MCPSSCSIWLIVAAIIVSKNKKKLCVTQKAMELAMLGVNLWNM